MTIFFFFTSLYHVLITGVPRRLEVSSAQVDESAAGKAIVFQFFFFLSSCLRTFCFFTAGSFPFSEGLPVEAEEEVFNFYWLPPSSYMTLLESVGDCGKPKTHVAVGIK